MLQRWRSFLVLLGLVIPSLGATSQHFENTAIVRTVELGGSLVHVTTTYAVKALEADPQVYTIAFRPEDKHRTSWLEAKIKGQQRALAVEDLGYDATR
jgi:oligosaccharyltransferase complex subunit alpha (ribophorin I)